MGMGAAAARSGRRMERTCGRETRKHFHDFALVLVFERELHLDFNDVAHCDVVLLHHLERDVD